MKRHKTNLAERWLVNRSTRGFTLLEVMISGSIFLVAFAGTMLGVTTALDLYGQHRRTTIAIQLAEGTIEELLLKLQGAPELAAGEHVGPQFTTAGARVPSDGFYQASWHVISERPVAGMKEVEVIVDWTGASRPVRLKTYRR